MFHEAVHSHLSFRNVLEHLIIPGLVNKNQKEICSFLSKKLNFIYHSMSLAKLHSCDEEAFTYNLFLCGFSFPDSQQKLTLFFIHLITTLVSK